VPALHARHCTSCNGYRSDQQITSANNCACLLFLNRCRECFAACVVFLFFLLCARVGQVHQRAPALHARLCLSCDGYRSGQQTNLTNVCARIGQVHQRASALHARHCTFFYGYRSDQQTNLTNVRARMDQVHQRASALRARHCTFCDGYRSDQQINGICQTSVHA